MEESLLRPTLKQSNYEPTSSYNINNLFYVAFVGGFIPTTILFARNAKWLKVENKTIKLLMGIGIALLFLQVVIGSATLSNILHLSSSENLRYLRWGFRILALLFYFICFSSMKDQYRRHIMLGGEHKPLLKDAILFIIIGYVLELLLMIIGKVVFISVS